MNKKDLINEISQKIELSKKDTESALNAFINVVTDTLVKGEEITISGFGKFQCVDVAERICRNPQDGSEIVSPAHRKVKFTVGKSLKDSVKGSIDE